jgi:subtilisin
MRRAERIRSKRALTLLAGTALLLSVPSPSGRVAAQTPAQARVDVLVGFDRTPGPAEEAIVRGLGGQVRRTFHLIPAMAATMPEAALTGLRNNPRVTVVEPDGEVVAFDAELDNTWGVKRIGAGAVHALGLTGAGVNVFVLDSGLDWGHGDLIGAYEPNLSRDFTGTGTPFDDNNHGTHVSGTIAARDNDTGVVGVAPSAGIVALKVLNSSGTGSWGGIIAALEHAVDNGARITNSSLGSSTNPGTLVEQAFAAAEAAGVVNIASAGNSGTCAGKNDSVGYPARFSSVIAVAATSITDGRPCFSSTGPAVEFAAPGVSVLSTVPGGYASYSGTSMSSPHVAGLVAVLIEAGLGDTNQNGKLSDEVRSVLSATAIDLGPAGRDTSYGYGLINAEAAVAAVRGGSTQPPAGDTEVVVSGITYSRSGGRNKDRDLHIAVSITTTAGAPVAGAAVSITVTLDGQPYGSATGTTGSNGVATFNSRNAPAGCYETTVTNVTGSGLTFGGATPVNSCP